MKPTCFLPVSFNCGASRSGHSVSMSGWTEVVKSSAVVPYSEVHVPVALKPMSMVEVDGYVHTKLTIIAALMRPEAEKKLGRNFIHFTPVYYMKKGSISYCSRVSGLV